jgi:hypothetical protein
MEGSMRHLLAVAALSLLAATPCAAGCHTSRFNFYFGQDVPATMRVTSGAPCSIKLVLGRRSNVESIAVTEPAKHGAASYNGSIGYPEIAYRSSPGYKGSDAFAFSLKGQSTRRGGAGTVHVSVDVE